MELTICLAQRNTKRLQWLLLKIPNMTPAFKKFTASLEREDVDKDDDSETTPAPWERRCNVSSRHGSSTKEAFR